MKYANLLFLSLILAACAVLAGSEPLVDTDQALLVAPLEVDVPNYGPAPELTNDIWLNVAGPLRLSDLRGNVVLLDMWTFG